MLLRNYKRGIRKFGVYVNHYDISYCDEIYFLTSP